MQIEGIDKPEPIKLNRKQRRAKHRNHLYTKKGYTRVIKRDKDGRLWNIPVKKGSKLDNLAHDNVKKNRHQKDEPYQSKAGAGR